MIWDGTGAGNANWSTKQNWGSGPGSGFAQDDFLIFGGNLRLTNTNNVTAGTNLIGITFNNTAGAFVLAGNSVTLGGNITNNDADLQTINLPLILSGSRTFDAVSGNLAVGGVISESSVGVGALVKSGSNTLTLSGANTYTGLTTVSNGILLLSGSGTLGAATGAVTVSGGTLNLGGLTRTRTGTITLSGGAINNGTLTNNGSAYDVRSGSASAILGGSAGLTKTTAGTVTLSGTNTYSGATAVNAGGKLTIASTGTINGTSGITITGGELNYNSATALSQAISFSGTGGTLSGSGTITPAVAITNGNTYTAGELGAAGTQALSGGITFNGGSIFSWDLSAGLTDPGANTANSGSYDRVTGAAAGTGAIFRIISRDSFATAFWNTNKSWNNIFTSGSLSSIFSTISGSGIVWNGSRGNVADRGSFTISGSTLAWSAIPEPTSALTGILLGLGLMRRRRTA